MWAYNETFYQIYPIGFVMHRSTMTGSVFRAFEKFLSGALICKNLGLVLSFSIQSLNRIITDMILEIFDQSTAVSAQMTISALSVKTFTHMRSTSSLTVCLIM